MRACVCVYVCVTMTVSNPRVCLSLLLAEGAPLPLPLSLPPFLPTAVLLLLYTPYEPRSDHSPLILIRQGLALFDLHLWGGRAVVGKGERGRSRAGKGGWGWGLGVGG